MLPMIPELIALVGVASVVMIAFGLHYDLEILLRERLLTQADH
jgi:hypothetical protein